MTQSVDPLSTDKATNKLAKLEKLFRKQEKIAAEQAGLAREIIQAWLSELRTAAVAAPSAADFNKVAAMIPLPPSTATIARKALNMSLEEFVTWLKRAVDETEGFPFPVVLRRSRHHQKPFVVYAKKRDEQ